MLEKIANLFNISLTQYKCLINSERTVEKRSLEGKKHISNILSYVLSFVISATFFFIPFLIDMSIFNFALIGITVTMVMIWMWTFPYFDILIYPINYPVVAHTPISSRTYFLVKFSQILSYTIKLTICLNLLPSISGIWLRGEGSSEYQFLFPLVYLPIALISGIFIVGALTVFAGFLTKLFAFKKLRAIAKFSQGLFPVIFPSLWVVFYLLPDDIPKDVTLEIFDTVAKVFYFFPNSWFAASISVMMGQIETRYLLLFAAAIISFSFIVVVPLQSIAKTYSKYLTILIETETKQKNRLRVKIPIFAKYFRNRILLAGYCMSASYLRRDKRMLQSILGIVGGSLGFIVLLTQLEEFSMGWLLKSFFPGINLGFFLIFSYFGVTFISSFLMIVRFSEHWKASWIFRIVPLTSPNIIWCSVLITSILYIIIPFTIVQFIIATLLWGVEGILYVLPNFIFLLYNVLFHPKPVSGLPFSEEINPKKNMGCMHFIYVHIAMILYISTFLITYWINKWVYIGVYILVVVGGFIGFVFLFRKDMRAVVK